MMALMVVGMAWFAFLGIIVWMWKSFVGFVIWIKNKLIYGK